MSPNNAAGFTDCFKATSHKRIPMISTQANIRLSLINNQ
nr:MAG TPA_asm: hypothetical protein [Caudoviricetes sp.]DAQ45068.1 MAG TPA: hypothetical protein [Caudoviricetes sp.]